MKAMARLDKIDQELNEADAEGKSNVRVFHKGDKLPKPERGILDVVFQMPKPEPVPPEFLMGD